MVELHSLNFRVVTTNFLGVRIFRKFILKFEELAMCQKDADRMANSVDPGSDCFFRKTAKQCAPSKDLK